MGNAASKKRLSNIISDHEKGKDKRDNNGPNSVSASSKDNLSVETNSRNVNNALSTLNNNINKLEDNSNNNNNNNGNNGNLMSPSTSMEPILLRSSNDNNENNNNNNNNKSNSNGNSNNSSNSNLKRADSIGSSLANTLSYGISSTFSGNSTNSSSSYNNNNISLPTSPTSFNERMKSIDIDDMIQRLLMVGYSNKVSKSVCLKNAEIQSICQAAREVFLSQPTLIELTPPVKIVGDVHGQYSDLIRLFDMCGFPPNANYLFLGDYVDRGKQSLETILLLLCYKIKYPENFFLLRGNHECANVTRVYGFYDECKRRSNIKTWKTFVDVFNCLPIAAVVANKIFCVHGGLSPDLSSMDEIRSIRRPTEIPDYGLLNDLLWSDPSETAIDWEDNERGVSYCFGKAIIHDFLNRHDFDLVCRAHMVVEDGYEFFNERTLVTVFSAPNYCGEFDNFGAVMSVNEELLCSFELLKPLDASMIKQQQSKSKRRLSTNLGPHSPPVTGVPQSV